MAEEKDKKRGLQRAQPPIDLFTLKPEPDLIAKASDSQRASVARKATRTKPKTTPPQHKNPTQSERVKTSVEFLPETLDLIEQMKSHYRREQRKHLPVWKILDEAIRDLADRRLK